MPLTKRKQIDIKDFEFRADYLQVLSLGEQSEAAIHALKENLKQQLTKEDGQYMNKIQDQVDINEMILQIQEKMTKAMLYGFKIFQKAERI